MLLNCMAYFIRKIAQNTHALTKSLKGEFSASNVLIIHDLINLYIFSIFLEYILNKRARNKKNTRTRISLRLGVNKIS